MFRSAATLAALALSASAYAAQPTPTVQPISGLYNTGEYLAAGQVDPHYSFSQGTGTAAGTGGFGVVSADSAWPVGPWLANTADSKWIAPSANAAESYDPASNGIYSWTLSFNLTGYDASSAWIKGNWAADNNGRVFFNGTEVSSSSADQAFYDLIPFSIDSGFNSGVNTLVFEVVNLAQNGGNPTGLRTLFSSGAAALVQPSSAVPEPATVALTLAGLAVVAGVARRRRHA